MTPRVQAHLTALGVTSSAVATVISLAIWKIWAFAALGCLAVLVVAYLAVLDLATQALARRDRRGPP